LIAWQRLVPVPGAEFFVVVGLISAAQTIPYVLDRALARRHVGLVRTLVFPAAWVAAEYLTANTSPFASWAAAGYTQTEDLPLLQMSAVTGVFGIGFLLAWFAAVANAFFEERFTWLRVREAALALAGALALVYLGGGARLQFFAPRGPATRV